MAAPALDEDNDSLADLALTISLESNGVGSLPSDVAELSLVTPTNS